jgi:hypothetical protein
MSRLLTETARLVLGMTRDAYGNLVSGQDERALHYLALQSELLQKFIGLLEDRNNYRKVAEVERMCKDIATDQHEAWAAFPAWDNAAREAHAERFAKFHDITRRVLPQVNPTATLEQARDEAERTGANSMTMQMSNEQLAELFAKH